MEEIINSILDAEKKAEDIIQNATAAAKKTDVAASEQSFEIKENAVKQAKAYRKEKITAAENKAEVEYKKIIEKGAEEVARYKAGVSSGKDAAAEEIFNQIIK